MGAWDESSFGNDTAIDWSYGLEKTDDLDYVEAAFDRVLSTEDESDAMSADAGVEAIAAAEVIARLLGRWGERSPYSETTDAWVESHPMTPPGALIQKATAALDRTAKPPSELYELWEESGDLEGWMDAVTDLRRRVAE